MDTVATKQRMRELEEELAQLRAELAQPGSGPSYRDLRDSLAGKFEVSDDLLEECQVKLDWEQLLPDTQP